MSTSSETPAQQFAAQGQLVTGQQVHGRVRAAARGQLVQDGLAEHGWCALVAHVTVPEVGDEGQQVGAVHGGVAEPAAVGPVAMGVEAAAARAHHRAGTALLRQPVEALLPGHDPGMRGDLVQGVGEHVQAGRGGPVVGGLQGVGLFEGPVGLDHGEVGRVQAQRLGEAAPAAQGPQDRVEDPDLHGPSGRGPAVVDGQQPARVRGSVDVVRGPRRRVLPGGVREQEVDAGRGEFGERVVDGDRVVAQVDGAEDAGEEVPVAGPAEEFDGPEDPVVAAAAVGVAPVQVVRGPVAVQRDADLDAELVEQLQEPLVERDGVGVDPQIQCAHTVERGAQFRGGRAQPGAPREEGFAAVQYDVDGGEPMGLRVLGDAFRRGAQDAARRHPGPTAPALVRVLVDVAVVAREIAATVHLQHELAQRQGRSVHDGHRGAAGTGGVRRRTGRPPPRPVPDLSVRRRSTRHGSERATARPCSAPPTAPRTPAPDRRRPWIPTLRPWGRGMRS